MEVPPLFPPVAGKVKKKFHYDMHWDIPGLWEELGGTPEPPQKKSFMKM